MVNLRCLNGAGIREFEQYLIRSNDNPGEAPPAAILRDPAYSTEFPLGEVIVEERSFANRREFATYLDSRFEDAGILDDVDVDGVWEWLSLFYIDVTCPVKNDGARRILKPNRYILKPSSDIDPRRHLLRNAYRLYRQVGMHDPRAADLLMSQRVDDYAKVVTHLGERKTIRDSRGALYAARELFYDDKTDTTKPNVSDADIGVQAFGTFLVNLPPEYDLTSLSASTILALLPEKFSAWIPDSGRKREIAELRTILERGGFQPDDAMSEDDASRSAAMNETLLKLGARKTATVTRPVRNDMFRIAVLKAYDARCAISRIGLMLVPRSGGVRHEVEAAHIVPVARGGKDYISNGLALNRTLHWAFDNGMLWINNEYQIVVANRAMQIDRNKWLTEYHGTQLAQPADPGSMPDPDALRWHAKNIAEAA